MGQPAHPLRAWALAAAALVAVLFLGLRVALWLDVGGPGFEAFVVWRAGTASMLVATLLCVGRGLLVRAERGAWLLIGVGAAFWTAGDATWDLLWGPAGIEPPAPNLADAFYLCFYGLACAGVVLLLRDRMRPFRSSLALDGLVAGLTLAAVSAALGLDVVLNAVASDPAAATVALAYPLADELMLGVVGLTFALTGWRPGASWTLLALGFAITSVADSVYAYEVAAGTWDEAALVGALWPLSMLTLGAAAWLPAHHRPGRPTGRRLRPSRAPSPSSSSACSSTARSRRCLRRGSARGPCPARRHGPRAPRPPGERGSSCAGSARRPSPTR